jgi:hypothetical protein
MKSCTNTSCPSYRADRKNRCARIPYNLSVEVCAGHNHPVTRPVSTEAAMAVNKSIQEKLVLN